MAKELNYEEEMAKFMETCRYYVRHGNKQVFHETVFADYSGDAAEFVNIPQLGGFILWVLDKPGQAWKAWAKLKIARLGEDRFDFRMLAIEVKETNAEQLNTLFDIAWQKGKLDTTVSNFWRTLAYVHGRPVPARVIAWYERQIKLPRRDRDGQRAAAVLPLLALTAR